VVRRERPLTINLNKFNLLDVVS